MSGTFAWTGRFVGFVLLLALLPSPTVSQEGQEAPPVALLGAEAVEEDLHLALIWDEDYPFHDPVVVLRSADGTILATQNVNPTGPIATQEVLEGALSELWNTGFHLVLEVQDEGVVLGDPLPFFALRQCDSGTCVWNLQVGLSGNALVTTPHLHEQLAGNQLRYSTCDLEIVLDALEQLHPHLFEEILQVRQQVVDLQVTTGSGGGGTCAYAWYSVVEGSPTPTAGVQVEHSYDQGVVDAEEGWFTSGAAYHHAAQARRLSPGATFPPIAEGAGTSAVTLDLLCTAGPSSCLNACGGEVSGTLDYSSDVRAQVDLYAAGGSAMAWAWEEVTLQVNGVVELQETLSVVSQNGWLQDGDSHLVLRTLPEPATFRLDTSRQLIVNASYYPPQGPLPRLPEQGAAHAYADAQNQFVLTVNGTAPTCPGSPTAQEILKTPPFRDVVLWKERGGLRIEKWKEPFQLPF